MKVKYYEPFGQIEESRYAPSPETNSEFTPENGCFEDDPFLLGRFGPLSGTMLVLGSVDFQVYQLKEVVQRLPRKLTATFCT